jgi:hypothetical protein
MFGGFVLVGKVTSCVKPLLETISANLFSKADVPVLCCQLTPGKLKSPQIMTCSSILANFLKRENNGESELHFKDSEFGGLYVMLIVYHVEFNFVFTVNVSKISF